MGFSYNVNVLNQKGSPAIYTDTFANRPAAGFVGRLFIANDTSAIYEDTGTAWVLIANVSSGAGTLQQVTTNGNTTDKGISISALGLSTNTLTVTSLTPGSVAFVGAADLITEDNANLFWDDTNNRLGINTNTPGNSLDIHGAGTTAILALNNTTGQQTAISLLNSSVAKWRLANKGTTNDFELFNFNLNLIAMSVKSTDNTVYIANSLGINNSAPAYNLDVNGTSLLGGAVAILGTNNQNYLQITGVTTGYSSQTLQNTGGLYLLGLNGSAVGGIQAGASAYAFVLNASKNLELFSGNVKRLTLDETTGQSSFTARINGIVGGILYNTAGLWLQGSNSTDGIAIGGTGGSLKTIDTYGGALALNGTAANAVLINQTTDDTVNKLQVTGSATISSALSVANANTAGYIMAVGCNSGNGFMVYNGTTGNNYVCNILNDTTLGSILSLYASDRSTINISLKGDGSARFSSLAGTGSRAVLADANGVLSAPVSDQSIKENIEPLHYGLDTIMQLNPVQFEFIDTYKNYGQGLQIGNIAQDVEKIIPEAVFVTPSTGLKGIDYNQFHGIYIKAIQDQQKIIEGLIERIEQLENK